MRYLTNGEATVVLVVVWNLIGLGIAAVVRRPWRWSVLIVFALLSLLIIF